MLVSLKRGLARTEVCLLLLILMEFTLLATLITTYNILCDLSARSESLLRELDSSQQENERLLEELISLYQENEMLLEELNASYNVKLESNFAITYPHGLDEYAEAILKICKKAYLAYSEIYDGLSIPLRVRIPVYVFSNSPKLQLGTSYYNIFNYIRTAEDLLPPTMGGPHHVFGFCHEIGHMMFHVDSKPFSEGWAIYAAAFQIVPYVYRSLGEDVWPQPYNYCSIDGPDYYLKLIENQTLCQPNSYTAATKILYTIDQKYGAEIIGRAITTLKANSSPRYMPYTSYPCYSLAEFKESLAELTDDPTILDLFLEYGF